MKNTQSFLIKLKIFLGLACLLLSNSLFAKERKNPDEWHFELKPLYIWVMSLNGSTSLGGTGDGESEGPGRLSYDDNQLTAAFTFHFEAEKNGISYFTDYLYAQYTRKNISLEPFGFKGTNQLTGHLTEFGAAYRFYEKEHIDLEILSGLRYLHIANDFSFNNNLFSDRHAKSNNWDVFAGFRVTAYLLESLSARVRADVGGGSSDLVWSVATTLDWRYVDWGSAYAGYKVLDYSFKDKSLSVDLQGTGPFFGLGFYW